MTARTTPLATPVYDVIGASYNTTRRADPRLEQVIWAALGDSQTVLNVGAGTGAYEPRDRCVVAVEPSATMRQARPPEAAPCLAASAESLALSLAVVRFRPRGGLGLGPCPGQSFFSVRHTNGCRRYLTG
jgi:hypothetical protein